MLPNAPHKAEREYVEQNFGSVLCGRGRDRPCGRLTTNATNPPGQPGTASGYTSAARSGTYVGEDIGAALGNAAFSSGTFSLPAGINTIAANSPGSAGNGDAAFLVETPEPATLALFGAGVAGLGLIRCRHA